MASSQSDTKTITRQALGRVAALGDLYNATTDTFCTTSIFRSKLQQGSSAISLTDNRRVRASVATINSVQEKLQALGISGELQLSVLGGLVSLSGSGKYLDKTKTSYKSVESCLLYNITTAVEKLDIFNDEVKSCVSLEALSDRQATHVVVQINWGADCVIAFTDENNENVDKTEAEGNLKAQVEKFLLSLDAKAKTGFTQELNDNGQKLSVDMFVDVLSQNIEEFPNTLERALAMMKRAPQLISKSNDGKGIPLTYILFPLSNPAFANWFEHSAVERRTLPTISDAFTARAVHLFDDISELRQKVHDQANEIRSNASVASDADIKAVADCERDFACLELTVTSDFATLAKEIRSGESVQKLIRLDDYCKERRSTAEELFAKSTDVFKDISPRILFAKRCERFGAKPMTPPVNERIAMACDEHDIVYVLFDGKADCDASKTNRSAFVQLSKETQSDTKTACYFTFSEENRDVRIEQHMNGKLVDTKTKNVVHCDVHFYRSVPFKVRCPGSVSGRCSDEERNWTCHNCDRLMQFHPPSRAVYCNCGHTAAGLLQFQCSSEQHGPQFAKFTGDGLQESLDKLPLSPYEAIDVIQTIKSPQSDDDVVGLTMLHQELFVLHESCQVSVYPAADSSTDLKRRRQFTVNGLSKDSNNDVTSCPRDNSLYMSDCPNKCIHKVAIDGQVRTKFALLYPPHGLSLTPGHNLLIACGDDHKLIELNTDSGQTIREQALPSNTKNPRHAVQVGDSTLLVHGAGPHSLHRVCALDVSGKLSLTHGHKKGSETSLLNCPRHVTTDSDNFIIVADLGNYRLAVFSPSLQLVRHVRVGKYCPLRLYLDHVTRRLYVGHWGGDVIVIQL